MSSSQQAPTPTSLIEGFHKPTMVIVIGLREVGKIHDSPLPEGVEGKFSFFCSNRIKNMVDSILTLMSTEHSNQSLYF